MRKQRRIATLTLLCLAVASLSLALAAQAEPAYLSSGGDRDDDIMTEGFEGDWPPAGWVEITTSAYNWGKTNWNSNSGTYAAWCWTNPASQDEWLVMPALDLSSSINPKLEWYELGYNWETNGGHHYIMVSTTSQTDPGAFSELIHMTPLNHDCGGFDGGPPSTVNLVDYVGESTVYVAFRYYGPPGVTDAWIIDDVRVYTPSGNDVGVASVAPDGGNMDAPMAITPQATVENFGLGTESFDVSMQIMESGSLVYSEILSVMALLPGFQEVLSYPDFTIQPGHYYTLSATTSLAGDGDASNDTGSGEFTTYFDTHVPLGMLFTNSGCGPCVQANVALDAYMPGQGNDVALMRIHVWWPFGGDIMYLHNTAQSIALVNEFDVSGVPDFWLDGFWNTSNVGSQIISAFNQGKAWVSPMHFDLQWLPDSDQLVVSVNMTGNLNPSGDYQLFCTLTEDNIMHNGGNGEPIHMQAFRRMFPSTSAGVSIDGSMGTHVYTVNCPLDPIYDYDELRGTVYVRDMDSGTIMQAGTAFLHEIEDATDVDQTAAAFGLRGSYPNPFNPKTRIEYALDVDGIATLQVFDPSGRLVRTLFEGSQAAGTHTAEWNGLNEAGDAVSSGIYLVRLNSGDQKAMSKVILAK